MGLLFTLSVNAQQITPTALSTCLGDSVELTVTPNDNNGTYRYIWSNNLPDTNVVVVMPNTTTTYTVTILIDSSSFYIGQATVTITVNQLPTVTASDGGPYCESNGPIQLIASSGNGNTYTWTGPAGFSSSLQNPSILATSLANAGTYTVTVTNNNGCSSSDSTTVMVNPSPTAPITGSNSPVCVGNSIGLIANGGYASYAWFGPNGFNSSLQNPVLSNATLSMTGTYQVNVTDANGCGSSTGLTVMVNPNPAILAMGQQNVLCFGGNDGIASIALTSGSFPVTYLWNTGGTNSQINNLTPGTYTVTATDTNQCSVVGSVTITQPLAAVTASTTVTNVSCFGGTNGMITVNASGGTGNYQYKIGNGPWVNNNVFSGLSTGNYTIMVQDANNCQFTLPIVTISEPAALTANTNGGSVTCNGDNNGTAVVAVVGGTSPYSYQWNNGGQGDSLVGLTANSYIVTVTDANNCTVSDTAIVTQPNPITFTFNQTNVLCNGQTTGSISVIATGGTPGYQYRLNNGAWTSLNTFSGLAAISYSISVRDTNQCSVGPVTVAITEPPTALQLQMADTNAVCGGNGSAWVLPSGGVAPYNFSWSNGTTNDTIWAGPNSYQVTVTDANGCIAVGVATIGQPIIPTITGSVTDVSCFSFSNGVVDMTPSGVGPFIYNWSNGSTAQDLTNVGAGIYTIIVTGANNCINTNQFTVYQPAVLTATAPSDTVACNGTLGSLTVAPVGGTTPYTYSWNTVPVQTGITATNLTAGVAYTVIVTDANGCTTQATGSVTQPSALTVNVIPQDINCTGNNGSATATVSGGTPFPGGSYTFVWSNGSQLNQAFGLSFGNHSVTVTDANGCSSTQQFTINPGNAFALSLQATDGCQGQSGGILLASATGGSGNFSYVWGNGATGNSFTALTSGTYTVTVTDLGSQCSQDQSIQVQVNPAIHVTLPANMTVCSGNTTLVYANVSGGTLPSNFAYQWQLPTGQSQTGVGPTGVNPVVTGNYTLTVSEGNCSGSATVFVNVSPISEPIAAFGYVQNNPNNFTFTSSSVNTSSLIWVINNQMAGSGQQFTYNFPVTGFYDVKLIASNECGSDTTSQLIGIGVTGISDLVSENVKIFPNPISSGQHLTVQLPFTIQEVHMRIVDFVGKTVFQGRTNEEEFQIPTSGLAAGTYMVQIATADQSVSLRKKLVVQ